MSRLRPFLGGPLWQDGVVVFIGVPASQAIVIGRGVGGRVSRGAIGTVVRMRSGCLCGGVSVVLSVLVTFRLQIIIRTFLLWGRRLWWRVVLVLCCARTRRLAVLF